MEPPHYYLKIILFLIFLDNNIVSGQNTVKKYDDSNIHSEVKFYIENSCGEMNDCNGNNISEWDVTAVTNMSYLFYSVNGDDKFNQDLSKWITSSVTNMNWMFKGVRSFNRDLKLGRVKRSEHEWYVQWCDILQWGYLWMEHNKCNGHAVYVSGCFII